MIGFKLTAESRAELDDRVLAENLTMDGGQANRSEMIRLAIDYSLTYMPPGWRPEQETT